MKKITNLIIIDASSSMSSKQDEVRGGIDNLLKSIRKDMKENKEIETKTIICQFSERFEVLLNTTKRGQLKDKSISENYFPSGWTALYDAIGKGFKLVDEDQDGVFVSIMTDGQENSSREFNLEQVKELISGARDKSWGITFMGTTEDAIQNAVSMGITRQNTMQFMDNSVGVNLSNDFRQQTRSTYYSHVAAGTMSRAVADDLANTEEKIR